MNLHRLSAVILPLALAASPSLADEPAAPPPTMASVLAEAAPDEWERIDPARLIVMQLDAGRVVIELAPQFAPEHVANILTLARGGYFDGLAIVRSQDNYVAQWGDPAADEKDARPLGQAKAKLPAEFDRAAEGLSFTALPDPDSYAPEVGIVDGFPAARGDGRAWLAHCYGMVGAGRGSAADSSNGSSLYAVTGHSPRHLDRNITLVGRVIEGMPLLSTLPRGSGALGFYEQAGQRVPIRSVKVAADMDEAVRPGFERLRSDSASFRKLIQARRFRHEEWFVNPVGRLELCNLPIPIR